MGGGHCPDNLAFLVNFFYKLYVKSVHRKLSGLVWGVKLAMKGVPFTLKGAYIYNYKYNKLVEGLRFKNELNT